MRRAPPTRDRRRNEAGRVCFGLGVARHAGPGPTPRRPDILAYVLGEAHALHRVCAGREDNTWRGRMGRLLQAEAPDPAYRQQLMDSFNAGFTARNAEFPACTIKSADAEKTVAAHGRDLARRIAAGAPP